MPIRAAADHGLAVTRRQAAAIFVSPVQGLNSMAGWQPAAIIWGVRPHRTWDRSSTPVTAQTPWTVARSATARGASAHALGTCPVMAMAGDPGAPGVVWLPPLLAGDVPLKVVHLG
jgi:hypothetical protein